MTRLKEHYQVDFDVLDFNGKLSINGLSSYMQTVAAKHATKLGINFYKSGEKQVYYWILARVKYEVHRYPRWEDQVALETYPGGHDKLFAVRLFDLTDAKGQLIGRITGDYLLMDAQKGRPVKIKGAPGPLAVLDFPYEGEKLERIPLPEEILGEDIRKAYYSELDLNGHMNNAHYIRWSVDMLPLELLKTSEIKSLQINYNTSVTYGVEVKIVIGKNKEGHYVIAGNSLDGQINYFTAEMILRPIK